MNILNIKVTCGPNYWSVNKHRLVVMELDIEEFETKPTNEIDGFLHRIKKALPGLYEHHCSTGEQGGFFERVERGTWMGHVVEHIAIELQVMAGFEVGFGRARGTGTEGHYNVVFECVEEESGRLAAEKAVSIAEGLALGNEIDIDQHVKEIQDLKYANMPGPSTASILREAASRDIPYLNLGENSTFQLGYGCHQKKIAATITSNTKNMAVDLACDKQASRIMMMEMGVPVAKGDVVTSVDELKPLIESMSFPLVAKPAGGNQGRGVTTNIKSWEDVVEAFHLAAEISKDVIIEQQISGDDYRLLVVDGKLIAAAKRTPAHVLGDGTSTIQELVDEVNRDSCRGECHGNVLTKIKIGPSAKSILQKKGYTLATVLEYDEILYLDHAANLSKGGTAEDVTDTVHPDIEKLAARISNMCGLDICGIDIMAKTLARPLAETGGAVLEINAAPGFRMHLSPTKGKARNVAKPVLDMLFPPGAKSRIPIIAVTGTNGKTTTTRLISHILKGNGRHVGYTTTDGIYVDDDLVMKGDCGGPKSAQFVLKHPTVDTAVLECARGGILRSGLGFGSCDVAVVTNVTADHLGLKGINDLHQMAKLKSVVPESVNSSGFAILNADDELVYEMKARLRCNTILFSKDADNPRISDHREKGGTCVFCENGDIVIWDGFNSHTVESVANIPLSFGGRADFMVENILAAVSAAYTQNIAAVDIGRLLKSFEPSPELTPGRMNMFSFADFDVLIDYAHNPAGLVAIQNYLAYSSYRYKIGIVCGIGDRRKEDSLEIGRLAAEMFDKVIIKEDNDLRGKAAGESTAIVKEGIMNSPFNPPVKAIAREKKALLYAMKNAIPGSLIVHCVENIPEILAMMKIHQGEKLQTIKRERKLPVKKVAENGTDIIKAAAGINM